MILGDICTRPCHYCAVTTGRPAGIDLREPSRLAETVKLMSLRYCVITAVNRDQTEGQASCDGAWERTPARIKLVGVGRGGCNCVRRMVYSTPVPGVRFATINTDIKALAEC